MGEDNEMAKRIKDLRAKFGLTLEQVAEQVGVGKSTVRKWETGMISNMRRDKIADLAKALHTTPSYLMGWDDEEPEQEPGRDILDDVDVAFYGDYKELSEDDKETLRDMAKVMKQRHEKKK